MVLVWGNKNHKLTTEKIWKIIPNVYCHNFMVLINYTRIGNYYSTNRQVKALYLYASPIHFVNQIANNLPDMANTNLQIFIESFL